MDETSSTLARYAAAMAAAVVAVAAIFGGYYWYDHRSEPPAAAPAPAPPPAAAADVPTGHPIDDRDADHVTPLDGSDAKVLDALAAVGGWDGAALRLLLTKDLVRHIVATVDALPREKLPSAALPLRPAPGTFGVTSKGGTSVIAAANARRYDAYVKVATALDVRGLVAVYRHFYPQFQQAYRELGYPQGNFNDRLLEVIDDLLEAPDPRQPIEVTAPGVMYHYVDPDLEALSAGQKMLVRVGPSNANAVKARLKLIRDAIGTP